MMTRVLNFARRSPGYVLWISVLAVGVLIGAVSVITVVANGLTVTNLSNQLPWGLWITMDLSAVAMGTGAFTLSAAVYILGMRKYEAIARAAIFIGLLGYTSAMIALFVDIGRPDRFYHPLIYWNPYSVLWGITLGVILYTTVLLLEAVPVIIESTPLRRNRYLNWLAHFLHRIMPIAALLGLVVSLLAQALYGVTYGALTARPVWFSPSAPVLFILSAIGGGIAMTIALTLISGAFLHKKLLPGEILNGLAKFAGFTIMAYLYLKLWSWAATNLYSSSPAIERDLELLAENTPYGFTFWWFEILLGALIPAILLLWPRTRRNRYALILAGGLAGFGLIVYRWNMTLAGFIVPLDWSPGVANVLPINSYEPSLTEWGVALGIVSYWLLAWSLAVRFLNLYPDAKDANGKKVQKEASVEPVPAPGD